MIFLHPRDISIILKPFVMLFRLLSCRIKLFRRGLNVTLSTDDPLLFHMSDDALLEEYSVARASFDLSMTDVMEIARNSILQSGFEDEFKKKWLGEDYKKGVTFCDEVRSSVRYDPSALRSLVFHFPR